MDPSHLTIAATSLSVAKDMVTAMMGVRDFNLVAEKTAAIRDQVLQAQDALFAHQTRLFELLNENFKMSEEIRALKEATRESSCYPLVDVGNGQSAYWVNVPPEESGTEKPSPSKASYFLCQSCLSNGVKSVLQPRFEHGNNIGLQCRGCGHTLLNTEGIKYAGTKLVGPNGISHYPKI